MNAPAIEDPQTPSPFDSYTPPQIATLVRDGGYKKVNLPLLSLIALGALAGAYIAFGGMFYTLATTDSALGFGPTRIVGGLAFSLGLVLVVIGGAELFTGNTMITMAWAQKKVTTKSLLRNWLIIYFSNFAGAISMVVLIWMAGSLTGDFRESAIHIAEGKAALTLVEAFSRGILCNILVCLAVWLCMGARNVSSKIMAITFPVTAFVALGFEHSVANMYLIPVGMVVGADISLYDLLHNLVPVTLGNIVGGGIFVALVYWVVYIRQDQRASRRT